MIRFPKKRHNFTDSSPIPIRPVAKLVRNPNVYWNIQNFGDLKKMIAVEREQGGSGVSAVLRRLLKTPAKSIGKIINTVVAGKTSTALKNAIAKLDKDPTRRTQHVGEKHIPLKIGKSVGWANYAGPSTRLNLRLRRGDPPRTLVDKVAMTHDIRYSLSKNINDIRSADNKMIRKLKDIKRLGQDSLFNTTIALRGIQGKKLLEDVKLLRKDLFLAPGKESNIRLLKEKLAQLEQQGFGHTIMPAQVLKKRIIRKLEQKGISKKLKGKIRRKLKGRGRKPKRNRGLIVGGRRLRLTGSGRRLRLTGSGNHRGRGAHKGVAKLIVKKLIPKILQQIKKLGVRQIKQLTTKIKDDLIDRVANKIKLQRGGVLGVLGLPLVTSAIELLPIAKDIAEIISPILFKLFGFKIPRRINLTRGRLRGKGITSAIGLAIAKLLFDVIQKKLEGGGLHGSGILSSILKAGKIIAKLVKKGLPIDKKIIKKGIPIAKGVFKTIEFLSAVKRKGLERKSRRKRRKFEKSLFQEI